MTSHGRVDATGAEAIRARLAASGSSAPRFGLFLFECVDADALSDTIARIPRELDECFDQVVVMLDRSSRRAELEAAEGLGERALEIVFHEPPHVPPGRAEIPDADEDAKFGSVRKRAFEHALLTGLDQIIVMRGDGEHAPEGLPTLMGMALDDPDRCVLVSSVGGDSDRTHESAPDRLSLAISTFAQNRILGMRLGDYSTSYRLYPVQALRRLPFQLNTNDRRFDSEILLQIRALGVPIEECTVHATGRGGRRRSADREAMNGLLACATAIGYRLHQAHVTRNGRYLVDHDVHYTLKHSETGSHHQVVEAIAPNSTVLDLGCSSGLLARPLLEKDVKVTGVDAGPGERLAKELAEYCQHDLDSPLSLPFERRFDYIVCADVIEHLKNRGQLLRGARRYLKPEGKLIISTPNIALWFYRLSLLVGRFEYGPRGVLDETHVHLYTGATFRREVENAGFHVIRTRVTALPFEVVFESTGRSRFVRGLASAYHSLARLWPSMFAYQYVLEARITTLDEESTHSSSNLDARHLLREGDARESGAREDGVAGDRG